MTFGKHILSVFIILLVSVSNTLGQQKVEREYKLDEAEVPLKARNQIDVFELESKFKWYKERGIDETTIEAKGCSAVGFISIEFTEAGDLIDAELDVKMDVIPDEIWQNISGFLDESYLKWTIRKIQLQYQGNTSQIHTQLISTTPFQPNEPYYEIVLKARNEDGVELYELLFDAEGQFLKQSTIIFGPIDNLQF